MRKPSVGATGAWSVAKAVTCTSPRSKASPGSSSVTSTFGGSFRSAWWSMRYFTSSASIASTASTVACNPFGPKTRSGAGCAGITQWVVITSFRSLMWSECMCVINTAVSAGGGTPAPVSRMTTPRPQSIRMFAFPARTRLAGPARVALGIGEPVPSRMTSTSGADRTRLRGGADFPHWHVLGAERSDHRLRLVGRFQRRDLVGAEGGIDGLQRLVQLLGPRRPDDRRGDGGLGEQPGDGHLRRRLAALGRDRLDRVQHRLVRRPIVAAAAHVRLRAGGARLAVPGQDAAGQRAPGDQADAFLEAQRVHLPLFLAIEQVVVVLHHGEARAPRLVGAMQVLGELVGEHRARADVQRLALLHHVVQRLDRLFRSEEH